MDTMDKITTSESNRAKSLNQIDSNMRESHNIYKLANDHLRFWLHPVISATAIEYSSFWTRQTLYLHRAQSHYIKYDTSAM